MCNSNNMFFASTNSGEGFINRFPEIFSGTDRLYIIKGGPGTGKSSLMKYIASEAETKGYSVERFCCASDPESLDGIIINKLGIGITDGTAPHVMDPIYPGAHSEIINLGAFWHREKLKYCREEIINMINEKSKRYDLLYRYLDSALSLHRLNKYAISSAVNTSKIRESIRRLLKGRDIKHGHTTIRLTDGITMNGVIKTEPYTSSAVTVYSLSDKLGISDVYFKILKSELDGKEITLSYDALDPKEINMIFIPSEGLLFCKYEAENCKRINTDRFISREKSLLPIKAIKRNNAQITTTIENAVDVFATIKEIHFSLEEIYIKAMDFSAKEEYQHKLSNEIFS